MGLCVVLGAEIGVVLLLLSLGLEYTAEELVAGLRSGLRVAALDLLPNFTPGLVAAVLLDWGLLASLILGGITYVSSSGIVAEVVDDLGWLANRETPVVLSLLVAEDLAMAIYLPLVGALLVGGGLLSAGLSLIVALIAAAAALVLAIRYGSVITRAVATRSNEALLLGVLGLALLVAGAAEQVHVSAAVGAFLIGLAFSGPVQERAPGLLRPLRDLFAASFFVFFSLGVDPRTIPPVVIAALLLAVVTGATKFGTAWWGARRAGIGLHGRRRAGALLAARGEFSIVIAEIGVAAQLHPDLGALAATYVLLLAIAAPIAARVLAATPTH